MPKCNLLYAQSGGVTAVINTTAAAVIETARHSEGRIGKVLAGMNGISGVLREELADTSLESSEAIAALKNTPSGAFGSCRYRLPDPDEDMSVYRRLVAVFRAHDIGYFLYNGGGDSQDTTLKISRTCRELGHPVVCVGIPKTIDNDLACTDNCPGFGSAAKYVAVSTLEASLDVASMCNTSTKVFVLEVMGRHAGWIAAAASLCSTSPEEPPHIILLPEVPFSDKRFLASVEAFVKRHGYCVVVASEGVKDHSGGLLSQSAMRDAFGHAQLGGVAPLLADKIQKAFGYKCHWAVSDYLQRSARHIASQVDFEQAYAVGEQAVRVALNGENGVMVSIERKSDDPYRWQLGTVPLSEVANQERKIPPPFIAENGMHVTPACRTYLQPLIAGEAYPVYSNGLPEYIRLKNVRVQKQLPP